VNRLFDWYHIACVVPVFYFIANRSNLFLWHDANNIRYPWIAQEKCEFHFGLKRCLFANTMEGRERSRSIICLFLRPSRWHCSLHEMHNSCSGSTLSIVRFANCRVTSCTVWRHCPCHTRWVYIVYTGFVNSTYKLNTSHPAKLMVLGKLSICELQVVVHIINRTINRLLVCEFVNCLFTRLWSHEMESPAQVLTWALFDLRIASCNEHRPCYSRRINGIKNNKCCSL